MKEQWAPLGVVWARGRCSVREAPLRSSSKRPRPLDVLLSDRAGAHGAGNRRLCRRNVMAAGAARMHRYSKMTEEEIKLDRYAKFRKLGQYEEFLVTGGAWKEARAEREAVRLPPPRASAASAPIFWHSRC